MDCSVTMRTEAETKLIKKSWSIKDGVITWVTGRNKGKPVAIQTKKDGHQMMNIWTGKKLIGFSVGRAAWLLYYGEWPELEVDHIDCDPTNHRKENLRLASRQEQCMNRKSGKVDRPNKGVYKREYGDKWTAQIWVDGKCKTVGTFDSEQEAVCARIKATKELHGEFANTQSYSEVA